VAEGKNSRSGGAKAQLKKIQKTTSPKKMQGLSRLHHRPGRANAAKPNSRENLGRRQRQKIFQPTD